jgi:hypothetical protein
VQADDTAEDLDHTVGVTGAGGDRDALPRLTKRLPDQHVTDRRSQTGTLLNLMFDPTVGRKDGIVVMPGTELRSSGVRDLGA